MLKRKGVPGREDAGWGRGSQPQSQCGPSPGNSGDRAGQGTGEQCVSGRFLLVVVGQRKGDKPVVAALPPATLSSFPIP